MTLEETIEKVREDIEDAKVRNINEFFVFCYDDKGNLQISASHWNALRLIGTLESLKLDVAIEYNNIDFKYKPPKRKADRSDI